MRVFSLFEALKAGYTVGELHDLTKVDCFFLNKLRNMAELEASLAQGLTAENVALARKYGYTEALIAKLSGQTPPPAEPLSYKMVDTCAAEFEARTPYFYSVPGGQHCDARERAGDKPTVVVLGSGPIRIGQGIEFDYSSVHCVSTLRAMGYDVVIINNNPETVSTDYDTASRLYFEPLCPEDVMGVIAVEKPVGVVVAFGGQTAISLAQYLVDHGVRILGTSAEGIDLAEDREKFDALLESLEIKRPRGAAVHSPDEAIATADDLGYPVLLRPSYVIGGQNMVIAHDEAEVRRYMDVIITAGNGANVLIDQYLPGTELECDVISDGQRVLVPGIMEHIERAGIHSGDSIAVCPPYSLDGAMTARVLECSRALALALGTQGLVNIQYLVYGGELYVIEVNPRASRTVPYLSKISGLHMADVATRVMMGETLESMSRNPGGDVLTAVTRLTEKLTSGRLTPEEETLSLKMLIHLVGDMHCPMHLGRLSDLGGNKRPVRFFGRDTNLHSVWDTNIPEAAHKWSYSEWQQQIDRLTDEEAAQIAAGEPADWVKETHEICKEIYGFTPEGTDISYDYLFKYTPVVERQFLRGGHRLARLLNEIYR